MAYITGTVSFAISGEKNGCTLNGSVLTSGTNTGSVTVIVTVAATQNYKALPETAITVTIGSKNAQTITAENVTATYGDTDKSVSASVTEPATGSGAISYAVKDGSGDYIEVNAATGALTIKKAGTAYVTVTAAETQTCEEATKDVTVTVSAADPIANPPTATATYGQTLADVALVNPEGNTPGTWSWANDTLSVGDAGEHSFKANFTPEDSTNYNGKTDVDVTVTVSAVDPIANAPTATATYGQTLKDVALVNPEGNTPGEWSWVNDTLSVGIVSEHSFKANFTPSDSTNYNSKTDVDVTVTVSAADPIANPPTATATYGQTLADVTLVNPTGNTPGTWAWVDAGTTSVGNAGRRSFKANFTPEDTVSYNGKANVNVTVIVGQANNPTIITTSATVMKGGYTVDLAENVDQNGCTGTVSYAISGNKNGCTLNGSVLTSGTNTGTVTVYVSVAATANYSELPETAIIVTIIDPPVFGEPTFTLPAGIKSIGESAFEGLPMTIVEIPSGCTSIGANAFKECTSLTQIRIPTSVTRIDGTAFDGCANVLVYGTAGSQAQTFCGMHDNCTFVAEN